MYKYKFTVFTPCYNSANTIGRVIESLKSQTFRDFEWILVDDGNDNLQEIVSTQLQGSDFPIKYIHRAERQGKPSAINLAVSQAEGEFFLIADADDSFVKEALEIFYTTYQGIPENQKSEFSGVYALCQDQYGNLVGTLFPVNNEGWLICSTLDLKYTYKVKGEKWMFVKTDIMKEFPFWTGDMLILESSVWFPIGNKYKTLCINKTLRTYYRYENDERLSLIIKIRYPVSFVHYYQDLINKYIEKLNPSLFDYIMYYKELIKYTLLAKIKINESVKEIRRLYKRLLAYLCVPLGYAAVVRHKLKYKKAMNNKNTEG